MLPGKQHGPCYSLDLDEGCHWSLEVSLKHLSTSPRHAHDQTSLIDRGETCLAPTYHPQTQNAGYRAARRRLSLRCVAALLASRRLAAAIISRRKNSLLGSAGLRPTASPV